MSDSLTDEIASKFDEPEAILDTLDESPAEVSSPSEDENTDAKAAPTIDEYEVARESVKGTSSDSDEVKDPEDDPEAAKTKESADDEEDLPDEVSDDELASYKPKTRRRMEKLLGKQKELETEVETLRQPADEYAKIETFLRETGTSFEQAGDAIELSALMHSNPEEAFKKLVPIVQELGMRVGAYLPQDLSERVKRGEITRQDALTLAKAQAGEKLAREQQQTVAQMTQRRQFEQTVIGMQNAVKSWEAATASSDPDYEMKRVRVQEKIELALNRAKASGNIPRSEAEAVALAKQAYADVTKEMEAFTRKPAVKPLDGTTRANASAPPRTAMEAAIRAVNAPA